jgi:Tfp pilus assembly protein FimV
MALEQKDIDDLESKIAEMRKEIEEQEIALRVMKKMLSSKGTSSTARQAEINLSAAIPEISTRKQTLLESIQNVVNRLGNQEFTVQHIEALLNQEGTAPAGKSPRARIAMELTKMENNEEVIRTYKGKGSEPHRFKKKMGIQNTGFLSLEKSERPTHGNA